jgi:phosphate transport system permease protein
MSALAVVSPVRRRKDQAARVALGAGAIIALVPLVLVVFYLLKKGLGAWSWHFFSTDPTGSFLGDPGGVRSAIVGTLIIVGIAAAIAVPAGIGVALYLVEYGKGKRFAGLIRYLVDVMTGVPSIVFGLFIYTILVVTNVGGGFTAWKGSVALALLMLPVVTRSSEVVLNLVPGSLREAALALGAPRWRVIFRVVLPSARAGLVTGSLLAVARAMGETAPLLFTAFATFSLTADPTQEMNSLPVQIFKDARGSSDQLVARAWGAALALVTLVLLLTLVARLAARRSRIA